MSKKKEVFLGGTSGMVMFALDSLNYRSKRIFLFLFVVALLLLLISEHIFELSPLHIVIVFPNLSPFVCKYHKYQSNVY